MTARTLGRLQTAIRSCNRCVQQGFIEGAHPILHGNSRAQVMIVGQAPGPTAAERPLPYSGATGRTLQRWLAQAGFEQGALHDPDRFYLTSVTKCFPGRSTSGSGDRMPSRTEVELCSGHLAGELRLVQPEVILALGRLSISTFLPSHRHETLSAIVGYAFPAELPAAGCALVLPLPHPSGVSRWHNSPRNRERLAQALGWLDRNRDARKW
ncbi:MAG: uracil-DNA glycosylase family protein [Chloroflexota bacterium]